MNPGTLILLCVVVFGVSVTECAGPFGGTSQRCMCTGKPVKRVRPALVQNIEIFKPSASCSETEIVITLKTLKRVLKRCLDTNGKQGKKMLNGRGKKQTTKTKRRRGKNQKQQ